MTGDRRRPEWLLLLAAVWFFAGFGARLGGVRVQAALAAAASETSAPGAFSLEVVSVSLPQHRQRRVFLYHTHTHEAYRQDSAQPYRQTEKWRTADDQFNVVRVGAALAEYLQSAGIYVTHDTTDYESPRLSTAYARSLEGLREAAEAGYDLYIDLHRDSYSKGNGPNTVSVDGAEAARLLILIGQGTGSSLDEKPDWEANQQAAQRISDALSQRAEGLCRGVSLKSGRYNQQAASPSMLIEVGNNQNSLSEALSAAEPLARAICVYFDSLR